MGSVLLSFFLSLNAIAFEIPRELSPSDRREVIRTVGINSAGKTLGNPYPLGGYSGFEVGYSLEFVNIRDLRRLGCDPATPGCTNTSVPDESEWRYSRFTVGKGLYHDVDMFLSFIPPTGGSRVSDYGGQIRWSFYQAEFLPVNMSIIGHMNFLNFNDTFMNRNLGLTLVTGVNVDNFSLYFGGGWVQARGTFIGQNQDGNCEEDCLVNPTEPPENSEYTVSHDVQETNTLVGISLHYQNLFAAAQVDRYRDAVYSLKVGLRF